MQLLIKNAHIVDTNSPYHNETVDVLIEGDSIAQIGTIDSFDGNTWDAAGADLYPGFAELHSDLGEPGNEESETLRSGAAAAAAGGYTAVGVVSNGTPFADNKTGIEFITNKSDQSPVHLIPIGTATKGRKGEELSEMFDMFEHGSELFVDYKHGMSNANLLKLALLYTKPFGRIMVHPEDHELVAGGKMNEGVTSTYVGLKGIPALSEYARIQRDLNILEYTEGSLHIASVSTAKGIAAIREAKELGLNVTCSVNIHHLLFTEEDLIHYDTSLKVSPPLRSKKDQEALLNATLDGTVDCLTVDHLPKDIEQKQCEFDNAEFGMAGFEGALCHLLDLDLIPNERIQELCSTNPRKLLGLPSLGIVEGGEAEFTIIGTDGQDWTGFASKAHNNPFRGTHTSHNVKAVFVKGNLLSL
jgi:dihydroorotase